MRRALLALVLFCGLPAAAVRAEPAAGPDPAKLVARLRIAYLQPPSFQPAAMRFPLRSDLRGDLDAAGKAREVNPGDLETRYRARRANATSR